MDWLITVLVAGVAWKSAKIRTMGKVVDGVRPSLSFPAVAVSNDLLDIGSLLI